MYIPIRGKFKINTAFGAINKKYWKNGHMGIDLLGDTAIFATGPGVVRVVGYDRSGWGNYISVQPDTKKDYREIFCHLKTGSIRVKSGDKVSQYSRLATMGSTGNSTGIHLHYQVNKNNTAINAAEYLGIPNKEGTYHSNDYVPKRTGWLTLPDGTKKYFSGNGYVTGIKKIDGHFYYFNRSGFASAAKIKVPKFLLLFGSDGRLKKKAKTKD